MPQKAKHGKMIMDGKTTTVHGMPIQPLDRHPLRNPGKSALHNHPQAGTKQNQHTKDGKDGKNVHLTIQGGKTAHMPRLPRGKEIHVTILRR